MSMLRLWLWIPFMKTTVHSTEISVQLYMHDYDYEFNRIITFLIACTEYTRTYSMYCILVHKGVWWYRDCLAISKFVKSGGFNGQK